MARPNFRKEFQEQTIGYIIAAFGLVAGLAWNDAIRGFIEAVFPVEQDTIAVKFLYAVIMTTVLVVITLYVVRLFKKSDKDQETQ